jgi:MFS family permease
MRTTRLLTRSIASFLALALLHASFSPQAWAQVSLIRLGQAPVGNSAPIVPTGDSRSVGAVSQQFLSLPTAGLTAPQAVPMAAPTGAPVPAVTPVPTVAAAALASDPASSPAAQVAPKTKEGKTNFKSGRFTARVAAKAGAIVDGVKSFFTDKSPEAVADAPATEAAPASVHVSDLKPAATAAVRSDKTKAPPVPDASATASATAKSSIRWFLTGFLFTQVGIEILGLAMPLLMSAKFGGLSALAQIAVYTSVAGIAGRFLGGWIANKFGPKWTVIGATVLRVLSIGAMVVFLLGPTAPFIAAVAPLAKLAVLLNTYSMMSVMIAFNSFNGFVAGVAMTAQQSIAPTILGTDRGTLERFTSMQHWLSEIIGVSGPKAGSMIIQSFGFVTAILVYPVMLSIAVGLYAFGIRMPDAAAPKKDESKPGFFSKLIGRILTPIRRALAPAMSKAGALFKRVAAFIDGLVLKAYLGRWIKELGGNGKLTDAHEQELLTRSTLGWMMAAMFSLTAFLTLLLPTAIPAYVAMVVFGVAQVIASQKLYSLILSRTKDKAESVKANAIVGAGFGVVATLAIMAAGKLFGAAATLSSFVTLNIAMVPLAVAVFFLHRMIKRTSEAGSPEPSPRPTSGFGLVFKDPMMRWAFLAYVALSVMNPLLYGIVSQAFGTFLLGGTGEAAAAAASAISSWITALYSFGGLLGALYMWRESTLISNAKKPAPTQHKQ